MAQTRDLHPWCSSAGSMVSRQRATEQPLFWPCSPGLFAPGKQITHDHGLLCEWDALHVLRHRALIPAPGCPQQRDAGHQSQADMLPVSQHYL